MLAKPIPGVQLQSKALRTEVSDREDDGEHRQFGLRIRLGAVYNGDAEPAA